MRWVLCAVVLWSTCSATSITTKAKTFTVMERHNLEMPCHVQDLSDGTSVVWNKADNVLSVDDMLLTDDERYSVTRDGDTFTLNIKSVEPIDSSEFFCSITEPEQKVIFKVVVNTVPYIRISPEDSVHHLVAGDENVVIRCFGKGNPTPSVSWERKDNALPSGIVVHGSQLVIQKATKEHSGFYTCKAESVAGSDSKTIEIDVAESELPPAHPWVKTPHTFIPVKKGEDATIVCTFDGSPTPQLEWFFNGYKINFAEERFKNAARTMSREKDQTKATLLLTKINEDTFGDYFCRASNKLGSEQTFVHVSGRPGPPKIDLDEAQLSWTVRSTEPIIEYRVSLRLEKQDDWTRHELFRVGKNDKTNLDEWSHEVSLKPYIQAGVKYEVQVKARNGLGWGSFAKDYVTVEIPAEQQEQSSTSSISLLTAIVAFLLARLF